MKLLIKFPTRERPDKFLQVLDCYLSMMNDKENYSVLVSADTDDGSMNNEYIRKEIDNRKNVQICYSPNTTKIEAVNADMGQAPEYDILLLASDDMTPVVQGYDQVIREKMIAHFPDTDGTLFFNDGHTGKNLNTLCILGRKYYERFNYIYHPSYISFYCDNEFMMVGQQLNRMPYFEEVLIRHDHYTFIRENPDSLYKRNGRFMGRDKKVYYRRLAKQFQN